MIEHLPDRRVRDADRPGTGRRDHDRPLDVPEHREDRTNGGGEG